MKLELSYIAINTDVSPPIVTTKEGFTIEATAEMLDTMLEEMSRVRKAILEG